MTLPNDVTNDFRQIEKSNNKRGILKTMWLQLQTNWVIVFIALVSSGSSYLASTKYTNNLVSNIYQKQDTTVDTDTNVNIGGNSDAKLIETTKGSTLGSNTSFNENDWIIQHLVPDSDGYYCPKAENFDYWYMWTKEVYEPNVSNIKIRFSVKAKQGSKVPPTFSIAYGDYKVNLSPHIVYRLNVFDTDMNTLRLYNNKNDSVAWDRFEQEPDPSTEMILEIIPRITGVNNNSISLYPRFQYLTKDGLKPMQHVSLVNFEVSLPMVNISDGTVSKQIGLGSSKNTCFKITGFEPVK